MPIAKYSNSHSSRGMDANQEAIFCLLAIPGDAKYQTTYTVVPRYLDRKKCRDSEMSR